MCGIMVLVVLVECFLDSTNVRNLCIHNILCIVQLACNRDINFIEMQRSQLLSTWYDIVIVIGWQTKCSVQTL